MSKSLSLGLVAALGAGACVEGSGNVELSDTASLLRQNDFLPNGTPVVNDLGMTATVSTAGKIDLTNEFFQDIGVNGRRCVSCHLPTAGWGTTPSQIQQIFDDTDGGAIDDGFGLGAMFRLNDGANNPKADVSTLEKRRAAYSMLLTKGLIRVGIPMPTRTTDGAPVEFELIRVDDPYGYASAAELSLFRRPLPTTNLKFLSAVMWDGRETFAGQSMHFNLSHQSNEATTGHAEGAPISGAQRESIVAFEMTLHTAATFDNQAKDLTMWKAKGGPEAIIKQDFYIGINDNLGDFKTGEAFTPFVFDLYDTWENAKSGPDRQAVARGQEIFNTRRLDIRGVSGINNNPMFGSPEVIEGGSCTTCHNSPNAGDHSTAVPLDIGLVTEAMRTPDMPLYTLRNKATGQVVRVTDPGRALITGRWIDIGKFKGPILRALASRAPYFHNGSAANLEAVVDFYDTRFAMGLSAQEKSDLVAFLRTL